MRANKRETRTSEKFPSLLTLKLSSNLAQDAQQPRDFIGAMLMGLQRRHEHLACTRNKLVTERPRRHKAGSCPRLAVGPKRGRGDWAQSHRSMSFVNRTEGQSCCKLILGRARHQRWPSIPGSNSASLSPSSGRVCAADPALLSPSSLSACSTASSMLTVFSTNSNCSRISGACRPT